jgi:hypothetical protein
VAACNQFTTCITKNIDRKNYLDRIFSRSWLAPQFILDFDQEESDVNDVIAQKLAARVVAPTPSNYVLPVDWLSMCSFLALRPRFIGLSLPFLSTGQKSMLIEAGRKIHIF